MIKRIAIVITLIIVVVLGRVLFFYNGVYSAPPSEMPSYEQIVVPPAPLTEFSDNVSEKGEGTVLVDLAHANNFKPEELNVLMLRLISRGLTIKFLDAEDDLKKELLGEEEEEEAAEEDELLGEEEEEEAAEEDELLGEEEEEEIPQENELSDEEEDKEEELKVPDAFIIVSPVGKFSEEEKETIGEFIDNGGKLLLIADPTRRSKMNSLSNDFGLIFEPDYLYNMKENEINYRHIFITEFKENEITKKLEKIVLYIAGSISSAEGSIAFVDQNTFSSVIKSRKELSPIVLTREDKVLAIYDLTFMTEPYNGILDNNQLIANLADWLVSPIEPETQEEDS